jgi:hypothetical protein
LLRCVLDEIFQISLPVATNLFDPIATTTTPFFAKLDQLN